MMQHWKAGDAVWIHYRCNDIGYGIEEGSDDYLYLGQPSDAHGKHAFEPIREGATMYLFDNEIISVVPSDPAEIRSFVVATGSIHEGITQIVGPFATRNEAEAFVDDNDDELSSGACQPFVLMVQTVAEYLGENAERQIVVNR